MIISYEESLRDVITSSIDIPSKDHGTKNQLPESMFDESIPNGDAPIPSSRFPIETSVRRYEHTISEIGHLKPGDAGVPKTPSRRNAYPLSDRKIYVLSSG